MILTGSGPDQRVTQPVLYAIGNLASKNKASQEALQNAGLSTACSPIGAFQQNYSARIPMMPSRQELICFVSL